jgi:SRSO17 transposase
MIAPREARPTVKFVDEYCEGYRNLFLDVRSFEAFKHLQVGIISEIKRKTLPAIAEVVGLKNSQSLHHFLTKSPWEVEALKEQRLQLILETLQGRKIQLIIDETGDRKKGKKTDYVNRQYIGNLGKIENGIVAVTAYGLIEGMTIILSFEIYKPKKRLKEGDVYRSKPEIAAQMVRDLKARGFEFSLVLADSLYGESESSFLGCLEELKLDYVVAIRSNHGVWMPTHQRIRYNKWRKFNRIFADGKKQIRYIREVIYGQRRSRQYWEITTDPKTLPPNETWSVMTRIPDVKYHQVGNFYGLRNWVEYGLKQSKNELGWADFRLTDYSSIEKWWEIVSCAYLMVSLHSSVLQTDKTPLAKRTSNRLGSLFSEHSHWDENQGWKNLLNNLRLILQPFIGLNLMKLWLEVFPIPLLEVGFNRLISFMNRFSGAIPLSDDTADFHFSSA